jgi:hypothetical protein
VTGICAGDQKPDVELLRRQMKRVWVRERIRPRSLWPLQTCDSLIASG